MRNFKIGFLKLLFAFYAIGIINHCYCQKKCNEQYWHDNEKVYGRSISLMHYTDSINSFDITLENQKGMSYVLYLKHIKNFPIPVEALIKLKQIKGKYVLDEYIDFSNFIQDTIHLSVNPYRYDNVKSEIDFFSVLFKNKYDTAKIFIHFNSGKIITITMQRDISYEKSVLTDIDKFEVSNKSFKTNNLGKQLKSVNYSDSKIISVIYLLGKYDCNKSLLVPITFNRNNYVIENKQIIDTPETVKDFFYRHSYTKQPKIAYFLYGDNKLIYYNFCLGRHLDGEYYHYGIQFPR